MTTLADLFGALQNEMIAQANFSSVFKHPTDKGDNTEECWIKWFEEYLPKRYRVAKATVIDCKGNASDQIDIVLYDAQYSYLAFKHNGVLYIPAESVYAVFEVKQNLTKENMEYAGKKAESVRKLQRTSAPIPHAGGVYKPKPPRWILAGILTTKSGWSESFGESFKNCLVINNDKKQVECGCVLESGSYFYDYSASTLTTSKANESLVYFFLQLLHLLQKMGTVPAIDLREYMQALAIKEEQCNEKAKEL